MKDIIQKDEYLLKESHQVVCTQKSLWVHKNLVLMDQNMSTPKVTSSVPYCLLHTVFVYQVTTSSQSSSKVGDMFSYRSFLFPLNFLRITAFAFYQLGHIVSALTTVLTTTFTFMHSACNIQIVFRIL